MTVESTAWAIKHTKEAVHTSEQLASIDLYTSVATHISVPELA